MTIGLARLKTENSAESVAGRLARKGGKNEFKINNAYLVHTSTCAKLFTAKLPSTTPTGARPAADMLLPSPKKLRVHSGLSLVLLPRQQQAAASCIRRRRSPSHPPNQIKVHQSC